MRVVFSLFALVVLYISCAEAADWCGSDSGIQIGSQCLIFSKEEKNWNDAATACASNGGRLATLAHIASEVHTHIVANYGTESFWVGGSDIANEGTWRWVSGEKFDDQFPWGHGEPNAYFPTENCLMANFYGLYADNPCEREKRYICELGYCKGVGSVKIGSQCLFFSEEERNWEEAEAACSSKGGLLATLANSAIEVNAYVVKNYDGDRFWAGGSDIRNEGTWRWSNGDLFDDQFPWGPGDPNGSPEWDQDCLLLNYYSVMVDAFCKVKQRYICELLE